MTKTSLFLLFLLLVGISSVLAQDDLVTCPIADIVEDIEGHVERLKNAEDDFWQVYGVLQDYLTGWRQFCLGLNFSGEPQPGKPSVVIGPVDIEDGMYRVTLKTEGRLTVEIEDFSGRCSYVGFVVREGEASVGAEDLFEARGCRALITVQHIQTPWSLTFEQLQ